MRLWTTAACCATSRNPGGWPRPTGGRWSWTACRPGTAATPARARIPAPPNGRPPSGGPSPARTAPAKPRLSSAGMTPTSATSGRSARSATAPARPAPSSSPSAPGPPTRTGNSGWPKPWPHSGTAAGRWITCMKGTNHGPFRKKILTLALPGRGGRERLERLEDAIQVTEHGLLGGVRILRYQRRRDRFVLRQRDAGPAGHERQRERVADRLVPQLPQDPGARLVVRDLLDHSV